MMDKKYGWINVDFDQWLKKQARQLETQGFKQVSTATVSKLLYSKIIIPNNITINSMLKDKVNIKKKGGRKTIR